MAQVSCSGVDSERHHLTSPFGELGHFENNALSVLNVRKVDLIDRLLTSGI